MAKTGETAWQISITFCEILSLSMEYDPLPLYQCWDRMFRLLPRNLMAPYINRYKSWSPLHLVLIDKGRAAWPNWINWLILNRECRQSHKYKKQRCLIIALQGVAKMINMCQQFVGSNKSGVDWATNRPDCVRVSLMLPDVVIVHFLCSYEALLLRLFNNRGICKSHKFFDANSSSSDVFTAH